MPGGKIRVLPGQNEVSTEFTFGIFVDNLHSNGGPKRLLQRPKRANPAAIRPVEARKINLQVCIKIFEGDSHEGNKKSMCLRRGIDG